VVPQPLKMGRGQHPTRTAVDEKLMERTGIHPWALRRLRHEFTRAWERLSYAQRKGMAEGGTCPRFTWMNGLLRGLWAPEHWASWLSYLEYSEQDLAEMSRGEYPISPYLIRLYSALFGIKVDFLLLGYPPACDRDGANIDVVPLTGSH
jgi:hypothetical protein